MEIRKPLNKTNVLKKVNQFDIFNCYCTPFKHLYKSFKSELRVDKRPTCSICRVGDLLIYRDFAELNVKRDCFAYIQNKYNVSFLQALEMINQDFNLKLLSTIKLNGARQVIPTMSSFNINDVPEYLFEIRTCVRKWSLEDKNYWFNRYDITSKTLNFFKVYPLSGFAINNIYTNCGSLVYGYYFGKLEDNREAWKIYQPYANKDTKWRSNCPESIIQGWEQLPANGDHLIITKSLKDVMVLYQLGIPAIAPQAESNTIPETLLQKLRLRFEHIVLLYDNDKPGIKAATALAELHNLPTIYMPEGTKDASDFVELYGITQLQIHLKDDYHIYSDSAPMGI